MSYLENGINLHHSAVDYNKLLLKLHNDASRSNPNFGDPIHTEVSNLGAWPIAQAILIFYLMMHATQVEKSPIICWNTF